LPAPRRHESLEDEVEWRFDVNLTKEVFRNKKESPKRALEITALTER
jgi:hypothetical protein